MEHRGEPGESALDLLDVDDVGLVDPGLGTGGGDVVDLHRECGAARVVEGGEAGEDRRVLERAEELDAGDDLLELDGQFSAPLPEVGASGFGDLLRGGEVGHDRASVGEVVGDAAEPFVGGLEPPLGVVDRGGVELACSRVLIGALEREHLVDQGVLAGVAVGEADDRHLDPRVRRLTPVIDRSFVVIGDEFDLDTAGGEVVVETEQLGLGGLKVGVDLGEFGGDLVAANLELADLGVGLTRRRCGRGQSGRDGEGDEEQERGSRS